MNPSTQSRIDLRKMVIQRQAERQSIELQDTPQPSGEATHQEPDRNLSETAIRRLVNQLDKDPGGQD